MLCFTFLMKMPSCNPFQKVTPEDVYGWAADESLKTLLFYIEEFTIPFSS